MANKTQAQIEFKAVTSDFRSGIRDISKDMTTFSNELRLNSTQLKGNSDDINLLEQRQNILQQQYAASGQKIELLNQSLEEAKNILGENSNEYRNLNNELLRAQTQQQAIQNEINQTSQRLNDLRSASQEAGQEISQLGNDTNSLSRLTTEIDQQQQELNRLKEEYKNVALEQGQSSNEAQQLASRIGQLSNNLRENQNRLQEVSSAADELDNSLNDAADGAEEAGNALENALAIEGVDELKDAFGGIADSVKEFGLEGQSSLNQLQAQLGLTNDEMGEFEGIINEIYADNFGESLTDIGENMALVHQNTGLAGEALKQCTENAYLLSDVYEIDIADSTKAADALMQKFGLTADEAYNLIAQGAESGLNKNDDLIDIITEYSPSFANAGYSAEDMFNALANGAETGAFSIDSLGDAFKEMNIRIMDGSADDYLKKLGFNADEFRKKYAAGGDSAKQVTQEMIERLGKMKDKQEQYNVGVGIFGTMYEDNAAEAIFALGDLNGEIDNSRDKLDEMNKVRYNDLGSALEGTKRILLTNLQPAISAVTSGITTLLQTFANLPQPVQTVITGVVALGVAFVGITTVIGMVSSVVGIFTSGWSVLTGAFAAVKTGAMAVAGVIGGISAPVLIVIGVITALVAVGVLLYKNWDTIKAKATEIWNAVKDTVSNAWEGIKVKTTEIWNAVTNAVSTAWNNIKTKAIEVWNSIKEIISTVWNGIKTVFNTVLNAIKTVITTYFNFYKTIITTVINAIKTVITTVWNAIKSVITTILNGIKTVFTNVLNGIKSIITSQFNAFKTTITSILNAIKSVVGSIWNGIKSTISSVCGNITSVVSSKFNVVKNTISNVMNSAKNIVSSGLSKIKGFFSNCHLSLPKIRLPHFSINGKLSLNPPSVPKISVSWHKKGGIMTQPTIFGARNNTLLAGGEAGQEAILPLDNFYNYLDSKLDKFMQEDATASEVRRLSNIVSKLELRLDIDGREFTRTAIAPNQDELDDYSSTRNMKLKY